MSYFTALGLKEEPFSNSPDPALFFNASGRADVLNLLEVSIRLRRGLNVVLGEVGTGKTTMCRQLLRNLGQDSCFSTHLLLDPLFSSSVEFLRVLYQMLFKRQPPATASEWQIKEEIKSALLFFAVKRNKIVVLIIDEGQKIQDECLELLRELLNFETNQNKLLQVVIFAQNELQKAIDRFPNLLDRIDSLHRLNPLSFFEMREMIRHRLELCKAGDNTPELFSTGAYWAIHRISRGYPRKVLSLCHKSLLALLMLGRPKATMHIVYKASGRKAPTVRWSAAGAICAGCAVAAFVYVMPPLFGDAGERPDAAVMQSSPKAASPSTVEAERHDAVSGAVFSGEPLVEASASVVSASFTASAPPADLTVHGHGIALIQDEAIGQGATDEMRSGMLGVLPLRKGELLSKAISKVYGHYRARYLDRILEFNPAIKDPDHIAAGTPIAFPAIDTADAHQLGEGYWLRLANFSELRQAVEALDASPFKNLDVCLLPMSDTHGLQFMVVSRKRFAKESDALRVLEQYPDELQTQAVIVRHWQQDALFHTDTTVWADTLAQR